jgi:indole-3-glycerol phosphate synthase
MILDEIVASRRARPRSPIVPRTRGPLRSLVTALAADGPLPHVIAEHKRRSPSAGAIGPVDRDIVDVVRGYEANGAAALSILTNAEYFGAAPDDLWAAREATRLPVLRKEFLLDEADVHESLALGADAILLIARLLPDPLLGALHALATSIGLDVLVEVHDLPEALRARAIGASLIGINHRDLDTLTIDLELSATIRNALGPCDGVRFVGESGLKTHADLRRMRAHGMDAVLIGESLLVAPDPGAALLTLLRGSP